MFLDLSRIWGQWLSWGWLSCQRFFIYLYIHYSTAIYSSSKDRKDKLDIIWCFYEIIFFPSFKTVNFNRVGPDICHSYEKVGCSNRGSTFYEGRGLRLSWLVYLLPWLGTKIPLLTWIWRFTLYKIFYFILSWLTTK